MVSFIPSPFWQEYIMPVKVQLQETKASYIPLANNILTICF